MSVPEWCFLGLQRKCSIVDQNICLLLIVAQCGCLSRLVFSEEQSNWYHTNHLERKKWKNMILSMWRENLPLKMGNQVRLHYQLAQLQKPAGVSSHTDRKTDSISQFLNTCIVCCKWQFGRQKSVCTQKINVTSYVWTSTAFLKKIIIKCKF